MPTKKNTTASKKIRKSLSVAEQAAAKNAAANSTEVTKAAAKQKTTFENFSFIEVKRVNDLHKTNSLFRVLDTLNKESVIWTPFNEKLTIDHLKVACPEYFSEKHKDKDGNITIKDRKAFQPWKFLCALRKISPVQMKVQLNALAKFRAEADVK